MDVACTPEMEKYFRDLQGELSKAYSAANIARLRNLDPEDKVDIVLAKNMAERVEGLIREVAPQLVGSGMVEQIYQYEKEYNQLDWRVGFKISEDVALQKFCKFRSEEEAIEVGIRVGFAYLTLGIVSAPLEGFTFLKVKQRQDGRKYLSLWYSGPVRGAGGTAAATSLVLGDYLRVKMGYDRYDPTEDEINRYVIEIQDYHERITNLQYLPTEDEIRFLAKNLPIEVNGEPTETIAVSNHKDLPRVETNMIRGGICLVLAEGLAQKSPKIWMRLSKWGEDFNLGHWAFLKEFLDLQKVIKSRKAKDQVQQKKIAPNYVYIQDLVAGRPILTHPMREGGFRLRYGRSRISGFSSTSIHPATMHLLNKYIATGTQLKLERPGKATAVTPNDSIEGPIVRLLDGSVMRVESEAEALRHRDSVKQILFLGDILISYGDFAENGHLLIPCGYNEDWYCRHLEAAIKAEFGDGNPQEIILKEPNSINLQMDLSMLSSILKDPQKSKPSCQAAISISKRFKIPLHPLYTYHWGILSHAHLAEFLEWLKGMKIIYSNNEIEKIVVPIGEMKRHSDLIGIPCTVASNEFVIYSADDSVAILATLGISGPEEIDTRIAQVNSSQERPILDLINSFSQIKIMDKSGTFVGARMGRPEKSKMRKLASSPHSLFPIGDEGGRLRSVQSALAAGTVTADFPMYMCNSCQVQTIYSVCEKCGNPSTKLYLCQICGYINLSVCPKHGKVLSYKSQSIPITDYFNATISALGMKTWPDLIKGVRGTSNRDHIPEHLAKGILRAKYDLYVNKDGTMRYDMTELPITHFKPKEIRTPVSKLIALGYTHDMYGNELTSDNQVLELKPQDVILPASHESIDESADDVLFRAANFIDELLVSFYKTDPYYCLTHKDDLVGQMVIGIAPHISAGMVARIIGFSETQACFAHPLYHAALRRDCDGDECCVILLMDGLLNFSRQFLPDKRGSRTMDSPLVLTTQLIPAEVDDMVQGLDVVHVYPLEFYEAAQQYKPTWEFKIEQLRPRLNTPLQYEGLGYTHPVSSINIGVKCSAYKTLPSMEEKLKGQMDIAEKVRAVDESDVARLVIEKHLIRDIKGNLRKFSQQEFRCVKCNEKFRRPPIVGKCTNCGGKLLFTISEGSVLKYLEPSLSLAGKYNVSAYLKQTLELTQRRIEGVFGKDAEKQSGLGAWFG